MVSLARRSAILQRTDSLLIARRLALTLLACVPLLIAAFTTPAVSSPIDLGHPTHVPTLAARAEVLEDPTRALDLAAVRALPDGHWQSNREEILRFGLSHSAWWVRLSLRNATSEPLELILDVAMPRLDLLDLYLLEGEQVIAEIRTGDQRPFHDRALRHRHLGLPFSIPPGGSREILLRMDTLDGLFPPIPLRLWDVETFQSANQHDNLLWGAYYGASLALLIYHLLLFVSSRNLGFLLYAIYLAGFTVWTLGFISGFGQALLWPSHLSWNNEFDILVPALVHIAATALVVYFLETRQRTPILHALLLILTAAIQLLALAILTLVEQLDSSLMLGWATMVFLAIHILLTLLYLGTSLRVWLQGLASARYFALAWSFPILGLLVSHLTRVPGLIPHNPVVEHSILIGSTLELLLLALALGDQFNRLRDAHLASERHARERQQAIAIELEGQVAERTRALHAAMGKAQAALEAERLAREEQRELLATISHDLRTPVAVIDSIVQNLAMEDQGADVRTRARHARMLQATERLSRLLDDYLSENRLSLLRLGPQWSPCDAGALLADAASAARLLSDQHHIAIEMGELSAEIRCDPRLTGLALRALVENAVKYTPPGSHITLSAWSGGRDAAGGIFMEVADDGPGIGPEVLVRLFEPYMRGANTRDQPGQGLGLALARRMIQTQGGSLSVVSALSHGCRFQIWLPESDPPGAHPLRSRSAEWSPRS
ncbi:MAG: hypothetical protein EOM91_05035 [Sphingobacteriia bacterium]|nr:hypothetical protein [Sphingobacteriia bacterium]NCC39590.1 hypothetical protein [Gammaproteobacteria bacterium]